MISHCTWFCLNSLQERLFWLENYGGSRVEEMRYQKIVMRQYCSAPGSDAQPEVNTGLKAVESCIFVQMNQKSQRNENFVFSLISGPFTILTDCKVGSFWEIYLILLFNKYVKWK